MRWSETTKLCHSDFDLNDAMNSEIINKFVNEDRPYLKFLNIRSVSWITNAWVTTLCCSEVPIWSNYKAVGCDTSRETQCFSGRWLDPNCTEPLNKTSSYQAVVPILGSVLGHPATKAPNALPAHIHGFDGTRLNLFQVAGDEGYEAMIFDAIKTF